ncbi:MAG: heme biosynthesis protein HemY [Woeseiaceae bacterium]
MKYLFSFFVIIFIAVSAGLLAHDDSGYVLFGRGFYTIEMSLSLFFVIILLSYISVYFIMRFILITWTMPKHLKQWRLTQQADKARRISLRGLINLSQGQWKKAERLLTRSVKNSDMPLLNYLSAAKAAQKLNAPDRRDHYLALAHKSMPEADFSVKLTQAELQLAHGQHEQALATLVHLHQLSPKHTHVMLLLSKLYTQLNSWDDLKSLLPKLNKHHVLPAEELLTLEKLTVIELIKNIRQDNKEPLFSLWKGISKDLKKDSSIVEAYCKKLISIDEHDNAEDILKTILRKQWHNNLVELYGMVKSNQLEKQLTFAESLSKNHDNNPTLLLTLGRICMYSDLWGKARAYLEASIGNKEDSETYKELGLLMEYLNEPKLAAEYFKKALFMPEDA